MSENNITGLKALLHGADYNPEQWLDMHEILERDIELMKKAGINCVSVGIFSSVSSTHLDVYKRQALAAPVELGTMLAAPALALLRSPFL